MSNTLKELIQEIVRQIREENNNVTICKCGGERFHKEHDGSLTCQDCYRNHMPVDESTPEGYEDVVQGLKKSKSVQNPWAVAWSMKKKGIEPK